MRDYNNINILILNIVIYALFHLVTTFLARVSQYISYKYNDKIIFFLENMMIEKFTEVDIAFYDSSKLQDKLNQIWTIKTSMTSLGSMAFNVLQSSVTFITALILLAKLDVFYIFVILILSFPVFMLKNNINDINNKFHEDNANTERKMWYFKELFVNNINSSFDIRLFNLKDFFLNKFIATWRIWYDKRKELTLKATILTFISLVISLFTNQILLYKIIIDKLEKKVIQLGDAAYYISVFSQFYNSTLSLIYNLSWMTHYAFKQVITVKEFLDLEAIVQKSGTLDPKDFKEITFSHVDFKYPGRDDYVLKDCNFTMKRGETMGLVGENGSGKSTIVKLMLRLYDIENGQILLDGVDIKKYDIIKYRAIFSVLFQDFISYSFTLRENIALSNYVGINDDEKINDAINKSELYDITINWENKLETPLTRYFDADGIELSGGQWQRVALARVFFSNRDFIILDEPSASLDAFAEEKIFQQFKQLSENRSSLIISHRLSSIVNADIIIVLKDGRIVEQGNHKQLLNNKNHYAELFNLQANRYI
jgi:ABC-type multidrug transport system fused ATPase/permease subunit